MEYSIPCALHLLVVSHSCCSPINQQVYAEIQRCTGWRISMVVPDGWRDEFGNTLQAEPWSGFEVGLRRVPVWKNGNIILHAYWTRWARLLSQMRPDVIYMNHEPYALATAQVCWANQQSIRVPFGFYSCQNILKRYPFPFSWLESYVYRHSEYALPITDDVAGVLSEKGYPGRMEVCALPLDPQLFQPDLRSTPPSRLLNGGRGPLIGFVGRAVESKGLRTLAVALERLSDLDWRLAVVGNGDFLEPFRRLMDSAGLSDRIQYPGYVHHTEAPQWLAAMDIVVVPSETQVNWKEQFGRVITEALACGVAVVGSDSGEIPNLICKSGGGLVFAERNAEALAGALREMILNPDLRAQCGKLGRQWVTNNVSLSSVADRMVRTFSHYSRSGASL